MYDFADFNKCELTKRYPHLSAVIDGYFEPDKHFVVNIDEDLGPVKVCIPEIAAKNAIYWSWQDPPTQEVLNPGWDKIDGFGKPAEMQWWEVPQKPEDLVLLEKQHNNYDAFWSQLYSNPEKYASSIDYIKTALRRFRYGYWFYNNGKPTYIDGWQYRLLTEFKAGSFETRDKQTGRRIKSLYPEYRDRIRRKYLFYKWCLVDTTDSNGEEYGRRTCFGYVYPKHRRDGATADSLVILLDTVCTVKDSYSSMIGNLENTGKTTFQKKFINAWRKQSPWLRPVHDGTDRPSRELRNYAPASKKGMDFTVTTVDSWIDYADKADRGYYDHAEISGAVLMDEEGKTVATDIYEGWDLVKPTMAPGGGTQILKHAFAMHPSTVEDMDKKGGDRYKLLCDASDYHESDEITGQTMSGLRLLFIPAYDGLAGYIGKHGESLMENLTQEQKDWLGEKYGSKEMIYHRIKALEKDNSEKAQTKLIIFKRQHPCEYKWCWMGRGADNGFNKIKLSERIATLRTKQYDKYILKGNLFWRFGDELFSAKELVTLLGTGKDWIRDRAGEVVFKEHPDGRFHMSERPSQKTSNKKLYNQDTESFQPLQSGVYQTCSDPFGFYTASQFNQTKKVGSKMSKGGGTAFRLRDPLIDGDGKDFKDWKSHKFIMDYYERPESSDEYCEEMLMMSVYVGGMMYPEINIEEVWKHFVQRGYGGFLRHDVDPISQIPRDKPGFHSGAGNSPVKQKLFQSVRSYIEYHLSKEVHLRILEQFAEIGGMEEMTHYDLFAAAAGNLMGASVDYYYEDEPDSIDLLNVWG